MIPPLEDLTASCRPARPSLAKTKNKQYEVSWTNHSCINHQVPSRCELRELQIGDKEQTTVCGSSLHRQDIIGIERGR